MKGPAFFAYAANYLIDLDHAVIVDVEASLPDRVDAHLPEQVYPEDIECRR